MIGSYNISTLLNPDQNNTISNNIYRGDIYFTDTLIPTKLKALIKDIENMQPDEYEYSKGDFKKVVLKLISIHTLNYLGFRQVEYRLNPKEEKINKKLDLVQFLEPLLYGLSQAQISYLPIALSQILK